MEETTLIINNDKITAINDPETLKDVYKTAIKEAEQEQRHEDFIHELKVGGIVLGVIGIIILIAVINPSCSLGLIPILLFLRACFR